MDTIPAAVEEAARRFGAAEALVDGPVRMSWRELHEQVCGAGKVFVEGGVRPGDRVAICAPNTHHWVLMALGALTAGATLVPVNTRFTAVETADILDRTHAKAFVVADEFLGRDRLAELKAGGHRVPDVVLPIAPAIRGARSNRPLWTSRSVRTTSATSSSPPAPPGAARAP